MTKENFKKGWMLFCFFAKIGCFTFGGGWSILAQMEQEFIEKQKLITKEELLDIVSIGKSVPGIMITNISTIFGYQIAGWFGAVCSMVGIALPAVVILSIITLGYSVLKDNLWVASALRGIRAAVVPIILSATFSLGKSALKGKLCWIICITAAGLCYFTTLNNIVIIVIGIGFALIRMGVLKNGVH
ncbi:MAG: chromate transporter [Lachnospiraceae bacterium]|nr:chromate transporter [Lachnospiraceae bacterium]